MDNLIKDKRSKYSYQKKKRIRLIIDECSYAVIAGRGNKFRKYVRFKHAEDIIGFKSAEDNFIYKEARHKGYHILTQNFKHFKDFPKTKRDVGVIGHSDLEKGDTFENLAKFVRENNHEDLFGMVVFIGEKYIKIKKIL